jgi:hypothetical protein
VIRQVQRTGFAQRRFLGAISTVLVVVCATAATIRASDKLKVLIVDRQVSDTNYSYVVPGQLIASSSSGGSCAGSANLVNCSSSSTTTGTIIPPTSLSYSVRGATFTLQLPDGRLVVVNCVSKYAPGKRRSCRMPPANAIEAEFDGDNAKLIWPVSLDGKKEESETYKILGILNK